MRSCGTTIELSASDLSQFLGCRHRTALDLAVAHGQREAPTWVDPVMLVLQQRGLDHERGYADALRAEGLVVVDLAEHGGDDAVARTLDAMRAGANVILQPALRAGRWFGRPDVLRRVETTSGLGAWSYQVVDTKLAKETRGGTVLQLALYSEMLGLVQDAIPETFHVVTPDPDAPVQTFRVQDFSAYFRFIRARLEVTAQQDPDAIAAANYPEPVEHCDVCRWWSVCDKRRRADDHLSLVAGIARLQSRELQAAGVTTLAQLGTLLFGDNYFFPSTTIISFRPARPERCKSGGLDQGCGHGHGCAGKDPETVASAGKERGGGGGRGWDDRADSQTLAERADAIA